MYVVRTLRKAIPHLTIHKYCDQLHEKEGTNFSTCHPKVDVLTNQNNLLQFPVFVWINQHSINRTPDLSTHKGLDR